jgi:hypothetical protein
MSAPEGVALTCKYCLNEQVKECLKCKSRYCSIHAAKFSPNFCKDCLGNLSAILEDKNLTSTEYDMIDDVLVTKSVSSKTLQLDGPDWIFYSRWIEDLPEDQWLEIYQFHYFVLKMMEYENELRKVKRARKIASAPLSIKVTKEAKTKKEITQVDMQAKLEALKIPADTIKAMLQAAGIPYREHTHANNGTS